MELQLKNIGMIKEAIVKIDGLTVIAGENDTGKSTLGKALFFQLWFISDLKKIRKQFNQGMKAPRGEARRATILPKLIFDNQMSDNSSIELTIENKSYKFYIQDNEICHDDFEIDLDDNTQVPIMIETPLVWNLSKFFNQMANIQSQAGMFGDELSIDYPFLLKDLHFRLMVGSSKKSYHIEDEIYILINGKFKKDDFGNFYFEKENKKISLLNTATGIKYFGIFQVLSQNNYLNKDTVLVLDELEVHLHPKWQLEMAKIIVELVKNGVKIVVNSHSPYMIEALKRYSELEEIEDKTNFYLAEDGYIEHQDSLENIFEKLALPMRELKKLKMDRYLND